MNIPRFRSSRPGWGAAVRVAAGGPLFRGLLTVAAHCSACNLDFSPDDSGDGPALFVMFLVSILVIPIVFWFEFAMEPAYWIHVVIWPPAVAILSIGLLRPAKALLVALHYKNLRHKYDGGS